MMILRRMKETIVSLGRQHSTVSLHIAKRLIVMKADFTNNHSYHLCILSQLLNTHPFIFSSHLSLLVYSFRLFHIESNYELYTLVYAFRECVCHS